VIVIPIASFIIGTLMILYATGHLGARGMAMLKRFDSGSTVREKSYVHEVPDVCPNCGGDISSETVDWVGPLSAKCPYCGATLKTEKREI